jgi:hypothetical protein
MDLRADLESRIYKTKKRNQASKWLFFTAMTVCLVSTLIYLSDDVKSIIFEKEKINALTMLLSQTTKEIIEPQSTVRPEDVTSPSIERWEKEDEEKQKKKQTVFNDSNYQPRGSVNTMAPPPSRYYPTKETRSKAQVSEVYRSFSQPVESRTIPWQWKSEKTYRSGTFTYTQRSGKIATHTICRNYKYGSFEYRDCRKAAKKYFKNACSSEFKAACAAGDMIP